MAVRDGQSFAGSRWAPFQCLALCKRGESYQLVHKGEPLDKAFAVLDIATTSCLDVLQRSFTELSFAAVVATSFLCAIPRGQSAKKRVLDISVNILGPAELIDDVGDSLSKISVVLQHPVFLPTGTPYMNPHYFYPGNLRTDLRHLIGPAKVESTLLRISRGIEGVLESLGNMQPHYSDGSGRNSDIASLVGQFLVGTTLKE